MLPCGLLVLLHLRAIYFSTFQYETPCTNNKLWLCIETTLTGAVSWFLRQAVIDNNIKGARLFRKDPKQYINTLVDTILFGKTLRIVLVPIFTDRWYFNSYFYHQVAPQSGVQFQNSLICCPCETFVLFAATGKNVFCEIF